MALEELLPCLAVFDFGTQSGSFAFMVEIGTIDSLAVFVHGYVAPDRTP